MGSGRQSDGREVPNYAGWVFHVGTSSLGYQFCRPRYLVIKGKNVTMYKTDPGDNPRSIPMRSGLVGTHLMAETIIDRTGSGNRIMHSDDEFDINGPRKGSRGIANIGRLITIGKGPEALLRRPSMVAQDPESDGFYNYPQGDTFELADWRCVYIVNGLRIFEDATASKAEKGHIMKSVGVIDAAAETIFEHIMSFNTKMRYQWDMYMGNLELVEEIDGHTDIVYGSFDPKFFKRFQKKTDFLFSRVWRRDQDGSYSITQIFTTHKKCPPKRGFNRINISPGIWEIMPLPPKPGFGSPRCLVTQMIEVKSTGWGRWKHSSFSKFLTTIPYILLCRTAGLRELVAANPDNTHLETQVKTKEVKKSVDEQGLSGLNSLLTRPPDSLHAEPQEEFYDALMVEYPDEDEDDAARSMLSKQRTASQKFKGISWGVVVGLSKSKKAPATRAEKELDWNFPAVHFEDGVFQSGLRRCDGRSDHGWSDPGGKGFMVRSVTYNNDGLKTTGGDPLLKLLAVDWLKSDKRIDNVAKRPSCCVQSDAGKKAPFILIINLQVPASPNYSLVMYFVSERPIRQGSLLDRFANGDNAFRNSRFKLIPSIVEGYWVVKRAVGTKACLLGKAVTCNYFREDNFLEIDVDIGSSSVARNVVGLVLGYVTSIVVDLAVLIEATNSEELPEYILGTTRINRFTLESAVQV
uniref:START domain-containing protein n=1 Tax=Physcomitrium patens TaxID=3218 RepID=A0A7I4E3M8_PHYPA